MAGEEFMAVSARARKSTSADRSTSPGEVKGEQGVLDVCVHALRLSGVAPLT